MTRRGVLAVGAALLLPARRAEALPDRARLLAPGPAEAPLAVLAARLAERLPPLLPSALSLTVALSGGPDGLAAAARFGADRDEASLLLLPGRAAALRLAGDPRARFEPERWGAVLLRPRGLVLAGRGAEPGPEPRVAIPGPDSAEALALMLLPGARAVPGLAGLAAERAFAEARADALFTTEAGAAALGAQVWSGLGVPGLPDPAPGLPEPAEPALAAAIRAAAAALRIEAVLVAPPLTAADTLAAWRWGAARLAEQEPGLVAGQAALEAFAALWPGEAAMAAWRRGLAARP
jgi:hypothetical protein